MSTLHEELPPQNLEAEQCVLGSMLLDREVIDDVADVLEATDFYQPEHEKLYAVLMSLSDAAKPVDLVIVTEELKKRDELEDVGGVDTVVALMETVPNSSHAVEYAQLVREASERRAIIAAANDILKAAWTHKGGDIAELVNEAEARMFSVTHGKSSETAAPMSSLVRDALERIDALQGDEPPERGIPSFYTDLDAKLNGLNPGALYVIAGRPSMGKSSFATSLLANVCFRGNHAALMFTLEVSKEQVAENMLCSHARVDAQRLMKGQLDDHEYQRVPEAAAAMAESTLFVDDTPGLSLMRLRAKARRLKKRHDLKLIIIDYLQLMTLGAAAESRQLEISLMSAGLKQMARELEVPVIALSQLNRAVESRPNKRPMMSDLRESGAIEQDADAILLLYREEYYFPEKTEAKGRAEVIVAKNRNGPVGAVELHFTPSQMRFDNPTFLPDDHVYAGDMPAAPPAGAPPAGAPAPEAEVSWGGEAPPPPPPPPPPPSF